MEVQWENYVTSKTVKSHSGLTYVTFNMAILHNQFSDNGKLGNNEYVLYTGVQILYTNWINILIAKHRPHSVCFVLARKKQTRNKEAKLRLHCQTAFKNIKSKPTILIILSKHKNPLISKTCQHIN